MRINVEFNLEYLGRPHGLQIINLIKYIYFIFDVIWRRPAYLRMNFK